MTAALHLVTDPDPAGQILARLAGDQLVWHAWPLPDRYWIIYARLSRKPDGKQLNDSDSCEMQIDECREHAGDEAMPVGVVVQDNDRSGWDEEVEREAFGAVLELAAADPRVLGILAYNQDRLSRNDRDTAAMVRLGKTFRRQHRKFYIEGPRLSRISLHNADGWGRVRTGGAQAAGYSDKNSELIVDELRKRARRGLQLGGGRLYGFELLRKVRDFEDDVNPRQRPAEAQILREVAERMTGDPAEPLSAIAGDLNRRASKEAGHDDHRQCPESCPARAAGLTTVRGGKWTGSNLARVVGAPRNGGVVVLNGVEVGRNEPCPPGCAERHGHVAEPILGPVLYAKVQAVLAGRRLGRRPTGRWLPKTVQCANPACGQAAKGLTMAGYRSDKGSRPRKYVCAPSNGGCGTSILAEPVEDMIRARVLDYGGDPDTISRINASARARASERDVIASEISRLNELLADLDEKHTLKEISKTPDPGYQRSQAALQRAITAEQDKLKALGDGADGKGDTAVVTAEEYDVLTLPERAALIRKLGLKVMVRPALPGAPRNRFDDRRVRIEEP